MQKIISLQQEQYLKSLSKRWGFLMPLKEDEANSL